MGSAAMDTSGDIGIGYSASSSGIHPAIRYAGRVPGDPLGALESEISMIEGSGSQTGGLSRWGDYSAMRIDPADDCTFWYTNEYLQSNGSFNWSTYFGSFKFASCGAPPGPDFSISNNPASLTQGGSGTSAVTVTALSGFSGSVGLAVTGCPSGATCSLPTPVTPTAASTLTVQTTTGTTTGTFTLTITGTSGSLTHQTTVSLTVSPAPSDFTISATPSSLSVNRSSSGRYTVTIGSIVGSAPVNLSVSGLPSRVSASFNPNPAGSPGTSTLTFSVNRKAISGTNATLTITGNNGSNTHFTTVTLHIN